MEASEVASEGASKSVFCIVEVCVERLLLCVLSLWLLLLRVRSSNHVLVPCITASTKYLVRLGKEGFAVSHGWKAQNITAGKSYQKKLKHWSDSIHRQVAQNGDACSQLTFSLLFILGLQLKGW